MGDRDITGGKARPKLTPREARFVAEYLDPRCLTAAEAARRAGYKDGPGLREQASRLLTRADVRQAVDAELSRRQQQARERAARLIAQLEEQATFDPADFYDVHGRLKPIHEIPSAARRSLAGIEVFEEFEGRGDSRVKTGDVRKVRFIDRQKAQELLAKHHGLLVDRVEHSGSVEVTRIERVIVDPEKK